jgi:hypothetical protein
MTGLNGAAIQICITAYIIFEQLLLSSPLSAFTSRCRYILKPVDQTAEKSNRQGIKVTRVV